MTDVEFEAAVTAAFTAFNERRFADFSTHVTDDLVERYPQSGEILRGRDLQRAMHEAFPDPPSFTIRRVLRDGDLGVVELDERYADGSVWKTVFILELRDGLIARLTGYFGEPFSAPTWRRPFVRGPE
ncbi:MAG TPA: nuclear transport factor 2 family protein [Candidatus Limnocylindria bacterium]|nr:nuclear transport factor 2 family protein [Candidatus Limnocylindria bacterium]